MSDTMPKAIKVTVEYDNGLEVQSIGEHAQAFMEAADFPYPGPREAKSLSWDRLERIPLGGLFLSIPEKEDEEYPSIAQIKGIVIRPPREET